MSAPLFSIVIPAYNRAGMIPAAINSVLAQSFAEWELIIIDDGSTDNTRETVSRFTDPRIKYFYQENKERSAARNHGIQRSSGMYICFLDSDDYYLPNHLSVLEKAIKEKGTPEALFYTGPYRESGGVRRKFTIYQGQQSPPAFVFDTFLLMNSVCVHRSILAKHKFIEDQNIWEDAHLWIRILMEYPFFQLQEYTTVCVEHDERGAAGFFERLDIPLLEKYVGTIRHLFRTTEASRFIPEKKKNSYIKDKYAAMAQMCVWKKDWKKFRFCLSRALQAYPRYILSPGFFKLMKEALIYSLKR